MKNKRIWTLWILGGIMLWTPFGFILSRIFDEKNLGLILGFLMVIGFYMVLYTAIKYNNLKGGK